MIVPGYRHFGGKSAETGALKNVLAYLGVMAPHTGKPFTEEMLLGVGGGVSCGYFVYEMCGAVFTVLGTRHLWQSTKSEFHRDICQRLGLPAAFKEAGGAKAAQKHLRDALARGRPAIASVGIAGLPYYGLPPEWSKMFTGVAVVFGIEEDTGLVYLADRPAVTLRVTVKELEAARAAILSLKRRLVIVDRPTGKIDLEGAITSGIRACVAGLTKGAMANFGLSALEKWACLVTHPHDKKGWPQVLSRGPALYDALTSVFQAIETDGTGGGAHRTMYADFLEEAAPILSRPGLTDVSGHYRECAKRWSALARAALPDDVKPLREAREMIVERNRLFEKKGAASLEERLRLRKRTDAIRIETARKPPLRKDDLMSFLEGLRGRILSVQEAERGAVAALQAQMA